MTAQEWRAKALEEARAAAVELRLPSGMVIRARRPDPLQLAAWGALPASLVEPTGERRAPDAEEIRKVALLYRDVLVWCCVAPRVPEEIQPREIPEADWRYIVAWALRSEEAEQLRPFRAERPDDGAGGDGAEVPPAPVGAAGDPGPGAGAQSGPGRVLPAE